MKKYLKASQKAAIVLAALKGEKTVNELSSLYQVHPTQIKRWKKTAEESLAGIFKDKRKKEGKNKDKLIDELYKIIGQRETELAWLKKKLHLEPPREIISD